MSLRIRVKKIELPSLEDENVMESYVLLCDMKAIDKLQNEYKISIMQEMMKVNKTGVMDEQTLCYFFGAMVRKQMFDEPIGIEIFEELQLNPVAVITRYADEIVNSIVEGLPKDNGNNKKKVNKKN